MNTYAKTKHADYVKVHGGPGKFKQFRKSQAFMPVAATIPGAIIAAVHLHDDEAARATDADEDTWRGVLRAAGGGAAAAIGRGTEGAA